jgi:phage FluMu protein Com
MDTVQFTCGHCGKLMAVAVADLGAHVNCPHCRQVVQAPAGAPEPAAVPPGPTFAPAPAQEIESIFTPPQEETEDLFGAAALPRVEMPPEPTRPAMPEGHDATQPWAPSGDGQSAATEPAPPAEVAAAEAAVPRPALRGQAGALALIFLVPYAVVMTGAFVYMLYLYRSYKAADPLERMYDPDKKDGPPVRVPHDRPLPDKLKTSLDQPLQVGDLEVKPLQIERTAEGDLVLVLAMRNLSQDTAFNPFPDSFARARGAPPYTYLQVGQERIYGGFTEWWKGPAGKLVRASSGELQPGEEMHAKLIVSAQKREDRSKIQEVLRSSTPLLWRVHVRRGFIEVRGQQVSGTAVIGVRFTAKDIHRQAAEARLRRRPLALLCLAKNRWPWECALQREEVALPRGAAPL